MADTNFHFDFPFAADVNSSTSSTADVSILVTEPSPEVPVGPNINSNQTLIHHVIVHRESEEYQTEFDEGDGSRKTNRKSEKICVGGLSMICDIFICRRSKRAETRLDPARRDHLRGFAEGRRNEINCSNT
jgi:hypothetical protein